MSEPTAKPLLQLNELTVAFDGKVVVEALSLTVNAGETLAIVGESGSGKSVSALGAIDLLPSNAEVRGERWLEGADLNKLSKRDWNGIRGNRVGFIFQEPMT
ncbi:MAG TPA: microcin ABC transporter ATP-binding protein, partial [Halomonas sp.]|nr:microcin ABC transporter ATP-binding protein [Halomonas sp.]